MFVKCETIALSRVHLVVAFPRLGLLDLKFEFFFLEMLIKFLRSHIWFWAG